MRRDRPGDAVLVPRRTAERQRPTGATSTYTVVVSNAGPDAANGAIVTDPAAAGLTKTSVTCAAAGGAVCPASPTVAQLESGLVIPTLPAGGVVTFTVDATVTAASGSVSNIATVAAPAGMTDAVTANNSATDTDAVVAAPIVADLAVTNTDNVTELVPGTGTVYTIVVTNNGPDAVTGATVTEHGAGGTDIRQLDVRGQRRIVLRERRHRQHLDHRQPAGWRNGDIHRAGNPGRRCAGVRRQHGSRDGPGGSDRSGAGEQHGDRLEPDGAAAEHGPRPTRRCADGRRSGRVRSALYG